MDIRRMLLFIVASQFFFVVIQYAGGSSVNKMFILLEYENDGELVEGASQTVINQSIEAGGYLLVGTLGKVTRLANFLSLFITFWVGWAMAQKARINISEFVVLFLSFGIILFTGVRSPLVSAFVGVVLCFLLIHKSRKKTSLFVAGCIGLAVVAVPTLMLWGRDAVDSYQGYGDTIQRSLSIFGVLGNLDNLDTDNAFTLGRSLYLLQFVSYKTFLFGTGIYTKNPFGYGSGISSITDCQAVFIVVEYGIFVFLLCLMPYKIALSLVKRRCSIHFYWMVLILFFNVFLQTIVDQGMFDMLTSYCFYLICALIINQESEKKLKYAQK